MCNDGDIRLNNGGIVELCVGGHYGYLCRETNVLDASSRRALAVITCTDLGYDPAGKD